ncbi:hypothetical protein CKO42_21665 [Lamprobacter modestohalophilus]|uniref:YdbS-like PH domain-containing protein n=1 Tax=Lamprobacter modestohalophilus TaxID=1064514 RepID=A0A9X0WC55_9GAMM|nr:PH domain-containing protein [Lamprobacter modestohalophilus]MBK1620982.1 hypothetical protein [Lamprobacter modestohalophilus]
MEQPLYEEHPVMFAAHPLLFLISLALIPVYGLGLLILLSWWLQCLGTTVTVTTQRTVVRKGILAKYTNEVYHEHVRNIRVGQSILQRLFGVGLVEIASAGSADHEIAVADLPRANEIKAIVDRYRTSGAVGALGFR